MSFNRWMGKKSCVNPYDGILFSDKRKWAIKPQVDMAESEIHIAKWKKIVWQIYILHDSSYRTLGKEKNTQTNKDKKKISGS